MSDITIDTEIERDIKGRFVNGAKPGPGRPRGARSKLGEAFLEDLRDAWLEHGVDALRRCIRDDPSVFVRTIAGLLPRDVNLNIDVVDPAEFVSKFRTAQALLGNDEPMKVIDARHR
jgi:hypothetical protein